MSIPSWDPDPTNRHQYRWWDGEQWTDQVADNGVQSTDPVTDSEARLPQQSALPPPPPQLIGAPDSPDLVILGTDRQHVLASAGVRLGARVIDIVIQVVVGLAIVIPIAIANDSENMLVFGTLIMTLLVIPYEVLMIALWGQTLGKMAVGVKVVRSDNGDVPGFGKSAARYAIIFALGLPGLLIPFSGLVLQIICYLSILWRRHRQGWHDSAAGTFVIKK